MNNSTTLNITQADLNQLEKDTLNLESQLVLGSKVTRTQNTPVFSSFNIDFFDFQDTEIPYFGV